MQVQKHYSRAPLTEAIIDIKGSLPSNTTIDTLAGIRPFIKERLSLNGGAARKNLLYISQVKKPSM